MYSSGHEDPQLYISTDDSTLYTVVQDGTNNIVHFWSWVINGGDTICVNLNLDIIGYSLKLSDSDFYIVGKATSGYASMRRFNIFTKTDTWAKRMDWASGSTWDVTAGASVLNSDSSKLFTLSIISETSGSFLVFATLDSSNGKYLDKVHRSDQSCTNAKDIRINGDKVYMLAYCTSPKIIIYDSVNDEFGKIFNFPGTSLLHFAYDTDGSRYRFFYS